MRVVVAQTVFLGRDNFMVALAKTKRQWWCTLCNITHIAYTTKMPVNKVQFYNLQHLKTDFSFFLSESLLISFINKKLLAHCALFRRFMLGSGPTTAQTSAALVTKTTSRQHYIVWKKPANYYTKVHAMLHMLAAKVFTWRHKMQTRRRKFLQFSARSPYMYSVTHYVPIQHLTKCSSRSRRQNCILMCAPNFATAVQLQHKVLTHISILQSAHHHCIAAVNWWTAYILAIRILRPRFFAHGAGKFYVPTTIKCASYSSGQPKITYFKCFYYVFRDFPSHKSLVKLYFPRAILSCSCK